MQISSIYVPEKHFAGVDMSRVTNDEMYYYYARWYDHELGRLFLKIH